MKCIWLILRLPHGSLNFRWGRRVLGYIVKWNKLGSRAVCGLILLVHFVPSQARSQGQTPAPIDLAKHAPGKVRKKRPPERPFVLVGAGDIASCKDPQGASDGQVDRANSWNGVCRRRPGIRKRERD